MEGDRQLAPGGGLSRRDYQREQYLKRKAAALEVASSKQLEEAAAGAAGVRAYDRQRYLKRKAQKQVSDVSCASKESPLGIICEPTVAGHAGVSCADPVVAPPIGEGINLLGHPGCATSPGVGGGCNVGSSNSVGTKCTSSTNMESGYKQRKGLRHKKDTRSRALPDGTFMSSEDNTEDGSGSDDDSGLKVCSLYSLKEMPPCKFCGAIGLEHEPNGFCCGMGKIVLHNPGVPHLLYSLFNDSVEEAEEFRARIRAYNSVREAQLDYCNHIRGVGEVGV